MPALPLIVPASPDPRPFSSTAPRSSTHAEVPPTVFTLERSHVALFLRRLFELRGRVDASDTGVTTARYEIASSRVARQVQHLLTRFGIVAKLRSDMETFLRANAKFPDFIEVGIAVFIEVYDWHVKNRQQLTVSRLGDGRYAMLFMFTTLILRPEQDRNYVGIPYDRG